MFTAASAEGSRTATSPPGAAGGTSSERTVSEWVHAPISTPHSAAAITGSEKTGTAGTSGTEASDGSCMSLSDAIIWSEKVG